MCPPKNVRNQAHPFVLRSTLSQLSSPGCVQIEQAHPCYGAERAVPVTWVHFVHLLVLAAAAHFKLRKKRYTVSQYMAVVLLTAGMHQHALCTVRLPANQGPGISSALRPI